MRACAPFHLDDLNELDERLFARADAVIAMEDVQDGNRSANVIALRHDCDSAESLDTAVRIAEWEHARGYRATFYMLHTSPYWNFPQFPARLEQIAGYGHEIGIHTNALAEALRTGGDPDAILSNAILTLRGYGHMIRGVAGHGDPFCNRDRGPGEITFANDEQFVECARPQEGAPDRTITRGQYSLTLAPRPLADFGLEYEALVLALPHPWRISDSGGRWLNPGFEETAERWDTRQGVHGLQLHFLWHPDWWARAFASQAVAA